MLILNLIMLLDDMSRHSGRGFCVGYFQDDVRYGRGDVIRYDQGQCYARWLVVVSQVATLRGG